MPTTPNPETNEEKLTRFRRRAEDALNKSASGFSGCWIETVEPPVVCYQFTDNISAENYLLTMQISSSRHKARIDDQFPSRIIVEVDLTKV